MVKVASKNKPLVSKEEILSDYHLAVESREMSLIGRKEVFMGKAKFGIFGDGKEVAQIAKAKYFQNGDFRSGYYRDQTFLMAMGQLTAREFFAQLYAHTSLKEEPASGGRMMNGHFGTRSLNDKGEWTTLTDKKNSTSDISPTAAQMPRLIGLAYASKLYRNNPQLKDYHDFSIDGNEVAFGTIGNAACAEGHFFEAMNAAGVLQVPVVMSIWDDEYGISVPNEYQIVKESISEALSGFQRTGDKPGFEIFKVNGWDYQALLETYSKAVKISRSKHIPCIVHVVEMTQPQGHSTSGSHERYKSKERLKWELQHDCIKKMREWIEDEGLAEPAELDEIDKEAKLKAKSGKEAAWKAYIDEIKEDQKSAIDLIQKVSLTLPNNNNLNQYIADLKNAVTPLKADIMRAVRNSLYELRGINSSEREMLKKWYEKQMDLFQFQYSSRMYSISESAAINHPEVKPVYNDDSKLVDGREVLKATFDYHLETNPLIFAIGEDVGKIGDVNQGFAGLQEKHGEIRVTDTGIRETTIVGQGIGAALRGLRPIVEIQYLDYLLYAIQTLSDDLATLYYRTMGGQKAPLIIRTRGHRLEGVWHSGSPMGMIINSLHGINILVPRNMTQAAGFYNTMLQSDDPALIIESLNGYRLKERVPENLHEIRTPLGVPEVLREGTDITLVTYGSMCRIVMDAAFRLEQLGISCEVVDVQSLIPFDKVGLIVDSLKKTNRVVFIDEDVPGGATAYMMQKVIERDKGYKWLDSNPKTITGKEHRPAYGSDGDYFSKPNMEDVVEGVYDVMHEADPNIYPGI